MRWTTRTTYVVIPVRDAELRCPRHHPQGGGNQSRSRCPTRPPNRTGTANRAWRCQLPASSRTMRPQSEGWHDGCLHRRGARLGCCWHRSLAGHRPTGKGWMVKHPETFGRPAAMALAAKPRFAGANLGFMCGSHNRLTVVDVDSPTDAELQHALETYGDSPIIVSTPSGGRHVYYAHNDEPRRVRLDERHPIDMLGGGLCVAPPSTRPSGASYAWLRGGLADIANGNLPKIRSGAVQKPREIERLPVGAACTEGRAQRPALPLLPADRWLL